jgi:hypothetical protein
MKPAMHNVASNGVYGAPWWIRTTDPQLRRLLLYPTELRAQAGVAGQWVQFSSRPKRKLSA